jgi:hypothetical protein
MITTFRSFNPYFTFRTFPGVGANPSRVVGVIVALLRPIFELLTGTWVMGIFNTLEAIEISTTTMDTSYHCFVVLIGDTG